MSVDPVVSIEVSDREVRDRLKRLAGRARDPAPAIREICENAVLSTDVRWEKEISPSGVPWPANTPYTIAQKRAQGRINKIMQSTGRGRASINYRLVGRDTGIVGTNVGYLRKHQLGLGVPKREFLGLSKEDLVESLRILDDYLLEEDR